MSAEVWSAIAAFASLSVAGGSFFWEWHRGRTFAAVDAMKKLTVHQYPVDDGDANMHYSLVNELLAIARMLDVKLMSEAQAYNLIGSNIIGYVDAIRKLKYLEYEPSQFCSGVELLEMEDYRVISSMELRMQQRRSNQTKWRVP